MQTQFGIKRCKILGSEDEVPPIDAESVGKDFKGTEKTILNRISGDQYSCLCNMRFSDSGIKGCAIAFS